MGVPLAVSVDLNPQELEAWSAAAGDAVFLEEFRLAASAKPVVQAWAQALAKVTGLTEPELQERLLVVHDDVFSFLARHATAVNAHIAIEAASKTVRPGALWYEETLPPESVLYVPVNATASRRKGGQRTGPQVLDELEQLFANGQRWLQLGGNETTGMGWCRVSVQRSQAGSTQ